MRLGRVAALALIGALVCFTASPSSATSIQRTIYLVTADQIFRSSVDSVGNLGMEFAFEIAVDPFTVQAGDQITTRIFFDQPLLIRNDPQGFFDFGSGQSSLEPFSFVYEYADGPSGIGSVSEAVTLNTMTLDVFAGNVLMDSISGGVQTGGGGMSIAHFLFNDWTHSAFMLSGVEIVSNIESYQLIRNNGEFHRLVGSISAGDISVLPVPEPSSITLFLLSLGLLSLVRRGRAIA